MTLIPFAMDQGTGRIVSIDEVSSGRGCGCICPSCHATLIARKGGINEWHFAHDHHQYQKADKECEFSFFVSVAMMAKQLIEERRELALPDYEVTLQEYGEVTQKTYKKYLLITKSKNVVFDSCIVAANNADIVGFVGNIPILLYLDYPGRPYLPFDLSDNVKRGVLTIDLRVWDESFREAWTLTGVKQSLSGFLFSEVAGKSWKYHPRQNRIIVQETELFKMHVDLQETAERERKIIEQEKLQRSTLQRLKDTKQVSFDDVVNFTDKLNAIEYKCMRCKIIWLAPNHGRQLCPNCYLPA